MNNSPELALHPKVSVIIPIYNHAHRVGSAIQSVIAQTYQSYEIIVVNDGSTDHLQAVLQTFNGIKLINHGRNLGRAAARNTGVLAASGEYIAFLDADDQWMSTKLEIQISFLEENRDVAICLAGYEMLMPNGQHQMMPFLREQEWERYLLKYIGLSDGSVPVIRRHCFENVGLQDSELLLHENWDWLLRAVNHSCKIGYINERLSLKSKNQKRPPAVTREAAIRYFVTKHADLFSQYGLYGRSAISLKWYSLAIDFFYEKKWKKGHYYLFKAIITWPLQRPGLYFRLLDALLGINTEEFIQNNAFYKRIKQIG